MVEQVEALVESIGTATLFLALGTVVLAVAVRGLRLVSPGIERIGWMAVILLGWAFVRIAVPIPWPSSVPTSSFDHRSSANDAPTQVALLTESETPRDATVFTPGTVTDSPEATGRDGGWSFWPLAIGMVWMAGMLGIAAYAAWAYFRFLAGLTPEEDCEAAWAQEWRTALARAGVAERIPLIVTCDFGPALCRLPKCYAILVPQPLWRRMTPAQRQAILAHELAHYQRGDVWTSLAVRLLALPHWFNPCAWYAVRRFDECGELACDAAAVQGTSSWAPEYARALLMLGEAAGGGRAFSSAARGHSLTVRVRRLLSGKRKRDSTMKKIVFLSVLTALVIGSTVRFELVAQETPDPASEAAEDKLIEHGEEAAQDANADPLDRAQVFIGENFFVAAVNTPLQRRLIGKIFYKDQEAVAYANINAKAFIVPGTGLIDSQSLEFAEVRRALRQIAEHQGNGQLRIVINYGYSPPSETSRQVESLLRETFEGMGRLAGFSEVQASGSTWNDKKYTWQSPKRIAHGEDGSEENVGTERVEVYAVQTSLSHYLTGGADCYIFLDSPPLDEWDEAYRDALRKSLETLPPDRRKKAKVLARVPERVEDLDENGELREYEVRLREIHAIEELLVEEGAVVLLQDAGFEEIILNIQKGVNTVTFAYD